jgi:hypothetical protein
MDTIMDKIMDAIIIIGIGFCTLLLLVIVFVFLDQAILNVVKPNTGTILKFEKQREETTTGFRPGVTTILPQSYTTTTPQMYFARVLTADGNKRKVEITETQFQELKVNNKIDFFDSYGYFTKELIESYTSEVYD